MRAYRLTDNEKNVCGTCTCALCERKNIKPFAWACILPFKSEAICENCALNKVADIVSLRA